MNTRTLPAIPTRGITVFPSADITIDVGRAPALAAVSEATATPEKLILLVAQKDETVEEPVTADVLSVGVIAKITQSVRVSRKLIKVSLEGLVRVPVFSVTGGSCFYAQVGETPEGSPVTPEISALINLTVGSGSELLSVRGLSLNIKKAAKELSADSLCDLLSGLLFTSPNEARPMMEILSTAERLHALYTAIVSALETDRLEKAIAVRVKQQMDKAQKDYYLREQIKAIQHELGDGESEENELLRKHIEDSDMPPAVKEKAQKEFSRMLRLAPGMPEISLVHTYLDWLLDLPWTKETRECMDTSRVRRILDRDHYGLEKVKDRILEYIAVCARTGNSKGTILCLVGPPGVGKTSIATSLAEAMNKKFVRMSLGGVRDEAEIRGHRRTYVASIPGRIISAMKQAGTINPLFLLDEIDKMSEDYKGDPSSALLEVLDKEQNATFTDRYLEVPYDLSKVMFVTTANTLDTIPRPLLDRMEVIELTGYTDIEKLMIAKHHLLPKQLKQHALTKAQLSISDKTLSAVIADYTREAGVRNLERRIADLCRKCVCRITDGDNTKMTVTPSDLETLLHSHKYIRDDIFHQDRIGVATGLAWTAVGGETLSIETAVMKGTGKLVLTGSLGDVMKESATAALSIIRANSAAFGINESFYTDTDIHVHVPEGATPKDGPSAGVSMLTSIISALSGTEVRSDTAMTGEITLSGRVLPIGGLKEKSIAACRAGVKRVIIPAGNKSDIAEIPAEVAERLEFIPVNSITQLLSNSLTRSLNGGN